MQLLLFNNLEMCVQKYINNSFLCSFRTNARSNF